MDFAFGVSDKEFKENIYSTPVPCATSIISSHVLGLDVELQTRESLPNKSTTTTMMMNMFDNHKRQNNHHRPCQSSSAHRSDLDHHDPTTYNNTTITPRTTNDILCDVAGPAAFGGGAAERSLQTFHTFSSTTTALSYNALISSGLLFLCIFFGHYKAKTFLFFFCFFPFSSSLPFSLSQRLYSFVMWGFSCVKILTLL